MIYSEDVRSRVFKAADELYAELDRQRMPTVTEVRARASCDNNAASTLLKEWKRLVSTAPVPVALDVPQVVKEAGMQAIQAAWAAAHDRANESLRVAEQSWESEREQAEIMRSELAVLADELTEQLDDSRRDAVGIANELHHANQKLAELAQQLGDEQAKSKMAEARIVEIERRADDLKIELDHSHKELGDVRRELTEVRLLHVTEKNQIEAVAAKQIEAARTELATVKGATGSTIENLTSQVNTLQERQVLLLGEVATLSARNEQHNEQRALTAKEIQRQADRFIEKDRQLIEAQASTAEARERAATLEGRVQALEAMNSKLTHR